MENKLNNRVVRQSLGSLGLFHSRRHIRRVVDWFDDSVREFTDMLEEIALARLAFLGYLLAVHTLVLYWVMSAPSSQDFLTNS
jgi:hypothetical protein